MKGKKILLTGSHGFVGRHFYQTLYEDNDVRCIDVVDAHWPKDARDYFRNSDEYFDVVIHLAAVVGGRKQIEGSPLSLAVDLEIDAAMFDWAMRVVPDVVVYFSSSAAYPTHLQTADDSVYLSEDLISHSADLIGKPDMTYGWAKLTGELLARHAIDDGLNVKVFRPFSGYGSDQDLVYPFPALIRRAQKREDPFHVWGSGQQARDWIHIDDIVDAVLAGIAADVDGPTNLCTGIPTRFLHLAAMVTKQAGYTPEIVPQPNNPAGVDNRVGDPDRMKRFYVPRISIEEGISRALRGL